MLSEDSQQEAVMDVTPGVVIWRVRRKPHYVSCVAEQVGEDCFELRIFDGHDLVLSEDFEDSPSLLRRAEALRSWYAAPDGKRNGMTNRARSRG